MQAGDNIERQDGTYAAVTSIHETQRIEQIYNFTVADFHTYYATTFGLWVHNCPPNGAYEIEFESGKTYTGKGDGKRASDSAKDKESKYGDEAVDIKLHGADSTRESFKLESRLLDKNGGKESDQNYNKIESPGKKYREQDGELNDSKKKSKKEKKKIKMRIESRNRA